MSARSRSGLLSVAFVLLMTIGAQAADPAMYPDLRGAWSRFVIRGLGGQPSFDQTKPWGLGQRAPLTPEYQKILEDSIADQAKGGQGNFVDHALCHPARPRAQWQSTRLFAEAMLCKPAPSPGAS